MFLLDSLSLLLILAAVHPYPELLPYCDLGILVNLVYYWSMRFTDKAMEPIVKRVDEFTERMESRVDEMGLQLAAITGLGMIAFVLVSIVAVTALVKASK